MEINEHDIGAVIAKLTHAVNHPIGVLHEDGTRSVAYDPEPVLQALMFLIEMQRTNYARNDPV